MDPKMHVVVIGAGIGGLTLGIDQALRQFGCTVTILEQTAQLFDVGAGIQLAPNATRILRRLGILDNILKYANQPMAITVRRYDNDAEIGPRGYSGVSQTKFDAPMLVIHRGDLQHVLLQSALEVGVNIRTDARVETIDPEFAAQVVLASGEIVKGDILVGADGINSLTRQKMASFFSRDDKCTPTGDAAYRVVIPISKLFDSPEILLELDPRLTTRWVGPHGHIMAYPIRGNTLYNVVMIHPSKLESDDETNLWTRKGKMSELLSFYASWSRTVQRLIECVDAEKLMEWPLNARPQLPSWTVNRTCLLGDACHPMLPYVAQGAAQAMEDAAALAICLSSTTDVSRAFSVYESLRKERAEFIQSSATAVRKFLHLVDGPAQELRDATMCAPRLPGWKHPDLWADPSFQQLIWGHDVMAEAELRFC